MDAGEGSVNGKILCRVSLDPYWRIWKNGVKDGNFANSLHRRFKERNEYGCKDDAARSMLICYAKKGTLITLYDYMTTNSSISKGYDYTTIYIERDLGNDCLPVWTFEKNYPIIKGDTGIVFARVEYRYFLSLLGPNGVNGRVSSFEVEFEYDRPATRPLLDEKNSNLQLSQIKNVNRFHD